MGPLSQAGPEFARIADHEVNIFLFCVNIMVKDLYSTPVYSGRDRDRTQDYPDRFGSDPLRLGSYITEYIEVIQQEFVHDEML